MHKTFPFLVKKGDKNVKARAVPEMIEKMCLKIFNTEVSLEFSSKKNIF